MFYRFLLNLRLDIIILNLPRYFLFLTICIPCMMIPRYRYFFDISPSPNLNLSLPSPSCCTFRFVSCFFVPFYFIHYFILFLSFSVQHTSLCPLLQSSLHCTASYMYVFRWYISCGLALERDHYVIPSALLYLFRLRVVSK